MQWCQVPRLQKHIPLSLYIHTYAISYQRFTNQWHHRNTNVVTAKCESKTCRDSPSWNNYNIQPTLKSASLTQWPHCRKWCHILACVHAHFVLRHKTKQPCICSSATLTEQKSKSVTAVKSLMEDDNTLTPPPPNLHVYAVAPHKEYMCRCTYTNLSRPLPHRSLLPSLQWGFGLNPAAGHSLVLTRPFFLFPLFS